MFAGPFDAFPRVRLAHLPTPLEPLARLGEALGGPPILIKRDDCTGLACGGNKTRKLEFLLAGALEGGADTVITAGGLQSNHVRQTAAAANRLGLACHLVLQRTVDWREPAYLESGNLLLDGLLGAELHVPPPAAARDAAMAALAARLRGNGLRPYVIPGGGSNAIGGLGYAVAAGEILDQGAAIGLDLGTIVTASASGGTQGGLIAGLAARGANVEAVGINADVGDGALAGKIAAIAGETAALIGAALPDPAASVTLIDGYGGAGYGLPTDEMLEALRLLARLEGLILDPVYTGKAMAGLIGHVKEGRFDSGRAVVFLHTGGTPGLFAYPSLFEVRAGSA